MKSMSLKNKMIGWLLLISIVLISFSVFFLYEAMQESQRAQQIVRLSRGANCFTYVLKDLTFERGRTNVLLSTPKAVSKADRDFIEERRKLVDGNFSTGIAWLENLEPELAAQLRERYAAVLTARGKVDMALSTPNPAADTSLRREWTEVTTGLVERITYVLERLGKKQTVSGQFTNYHRFIIDALEFRNMIGKNATFMTATLKMNSAWTLEEYRYFIEVRAQADYIWLKMESDLATINETDLNKIMRQVGYIYYEKYRPEQEKLISAALIGEVSAAEAAKLQTLSVEAFDSVFLLIDQIRQSIITDMQKQKEFAERKLFGALLQFLAGLSLMVLALLYFNANLFRPLENITKALRSICIGENVPLLKQETQRGDEIGQLAIGVEMLQASIAEERRLRDLNEYLAMTDSLTGCLNKRCFYQRAEAEMDRALRENKKIAFALIDLDNMKTINDSYGHIAGDEVLKYLVSVLTEHCRSYDLIGRFGGDEFMLCMQNHDDSQTLKVCERIVTALDKHPLTLPNSSDSIFLRISVGIVAGYVQNDRPLAWFIHEADQAMYQAKQNNNEKIIFTSA
jgi:diguanylate cyclase (GGDEF)-like protein